jgi:hypothetical protein
MAFFYFNLMRHLITFILVIVISLSVQAQESFLHQKLDTLKASNRSGGESLDSIDLVFSEKFSSTPGSFTTNPFGKYNNDYKGFFQSLNSQHRDLQRIGFKYSAIPHLGSYYAFGSKGTQYLVVDYSQSINSKIHLAFNYNRNVASGAYRYNAFTNDFFSFGILYKGYRWNHEIIAATLKQQRNLNGGISSFEEVENYGLEFAKVRKQQTSDSISSYSFKTFSEWGIFKKDSLKGFAFELKNKLVIDKRVFKEKDSLTVWYPNSILFDSLTTRDLTQFSRLDNQFGLRYKNNKLFSELLIDKGLWKYKTHSSQFRNEIDLLANLYYVSDKFVIKSENQQNVVGANQQSKFRALVAFIGDKMNFMVDLNRSNLLPNPMQRIYITNTLNYITNDLKLQQTQSLQVEIKIKRKQSIVFSSFLANYKNKYYFIKDKWRNDTLNSISQLTFQIKGDFCFGLFHVQPNLQLNLVDKVQLLPKYDLRTRFFIAKQFKRPGTSFNLGVDVNYKSTYQLMTFDDRISLYQMNFKNGYYLDYVNLDAFVSMQLDEFRLYFKMENLDSFWTNPKNNIAVNYPIVPTIMRIGLTWDFFN